MLLLYRLYLLRGFTYFQLTQAATTPNGSHLTSFCLYIIKKFVGLFSGLNAFSPCCMTHFSFSAVTRISPKLASTFVFPESKHDIVAIVSWFASMYLPEQFQSATEAMWSEGVDSNGQHT